MKHRSSSRPALLAVVGLAVACAESSSAPVASPVAETLEPSRLCVVRHAQAFKNLDPRPEDLTPEQRDSLTPEGEAQARALAARIPAEVALVLTSPASRTQQTAARLASVTPRVEPALRPLDGALSWDARVAAWTRGEDPRPEGGESLADGAARTGALLARLRAELTPGQVAIVVTHGDVAALLLGELRETPLLERPTREALGEAEMRCEPLE